MSTDSETRKTLTKDERGVILLEFAFSFIVLVILFLGMVTFSFVLKDYVSAQRVAREGAREAVITGSTNAAYSKACEAAWLWGLKPENLSIWFSQDASGNRTFEECYVKYRTNLFNYTFPTLVGQAPLNDFDINTSATFGWMDFTGNKP